MAGEHVVELTKENFDAEVIQSEQPVLVDFWAPWCGPCRAIAPMIDELAAENVGKMKIGKLNIDEAQEISTQFGVDVIPTLLIFKAGQVIERFSGGQPKSRLQEACDSSVA